MGDMVNQNQIGVTIDLNDSNNAEKIWNWYQKVEWESFSEQCKTELDRILDEQNETRNTIIKWVAEESK